MPFITNQFWWDSDFHPDWINRLQVRTNLERVDETKHEERKQWMSEKGHGWL